MRSLRTGWAVRRDAKFRAFGAAFGFAMLISSVAAHSEASAPIQVRPELKAQLAATPVNESLLVLVTGNTTERAVAATKAAGLAPVEVFERFALVAAVGHPQAVLAVHEQPGVRRVDADLRLEPQDDIAHRSTGVSALRNTKTYPNKGRQTTRSPNLRDLLRPDGTAYDGTGVSIAVIDGSFDTTHEQFTEGGVSKFDVHLRQGCPLPREIIIHTAGQDPSPDCSLWLPVTTGDDDNDHGHGTPVAATAAGYLRTTPSGSNVSGVAPGARLVGLSTGVGGTNYNAVSALHWVLDHHTDPCGDGSCPSIRVVNASWALPADDDLATRRFDPGHPISRVTTSLVEDGVVVVFAANNSGGDGGKATTNWFGMNPLPGVLLVGAYNDFNAGDRDLMVWGSSSRGKRGELVTYPDLLAPGVDFTIACSPGTQLCTSVPGGDPLGDGNYGTFSGTSISAPYIAAVVAQLIEADPTITPANIEDVLEDSAHQLGPPGHLETDVYSDWAGNTMGNQDHLTSFDAGHGNVDIVGALSLVLNRRARSAPDPCGHVSASSFTDPTGDVRFAYQPVPMGQPGLDVVGVSASLEAEPGAIKVVVTYEDLQEVAPTPMHTTVLVSIDRGGNLDPNGGVSAQVDLDRTASGDQFSVFNDCLLCPDEGAVEVVGAVDPAANTATFVIRPRAGVQERASVTRVWTSNRTDVGSWLLTQDGDVTNGGCSVWL